MTDPGGARRVVVVGAGISGLAAAHRLEEMRRAGAPVGAITVLEARDRIGGQVRTRRHGPYLVESGADTLIASKPAGVELCRRLGLEDALIHPGSAYGGAHILRDRALHRLPEGAMMLAPRSLRAVWSSSLLSPWARLRFSVERFVPRRGTEPDPDDETLGRFVKRRFGREILERIAEPVLAGLYTGDADRLGMRSYFPHLHALEAKYGSVAAAASALRRKRRGREPGPPFRYLEGGFGRIFDAIVARLPEGAVRTGCRVRDLEPAPDGSWRVRVEGGPDLEADDVLVAAPAHAAAPWLSRLDARLGDALREMRYVSCATVTLAYGRGEVAHPLDSFGFFVPRSEGIAMLACSFVNVKFRERAPEDEALFRVFLGGARDPEVLRRDDPELVAAAHAALAPVLGLARGPRFARVARFARAMPQFPVGFAERTARVLERLDGIPGLRLAGSTVGAVGLPDCIRSGESAAETIVDVERGAPDARETSGPVSAAAGPGA